uniref:Protein FAM117B-like n=1 Tax=Phascolarctos cinereus TaxID=38626 RepID=A0A6P5KYI7_PHACI|nr:protein FAM117B-like [Phascolarctos cinereus]XP_020849658.1 protein FAM117B-like [Phascolarctos cinereus]XP_020849659.1 protein FAM117B-like [Phascolarctos cinereus]
MLVTNLGDQRPQTVAAAASRTQRAEWGLPRGEERRPGGGCSSGGCSGSRRAGAGGGKGSRCPRASASAARAPSSGTSARRTPPARVENSPSAAPGQLPANQGPAPRSPREVGGRGAGSRSAPSPSPACAHSVGTSRNTEMGGLTVEI